MLMLNDLRLPAIKQSWSDIAERADKEGWPAARFLAALAEHEIAERDRRRLARHLGRVNLKYHNQMRFAPDLLASIFYKDVLCQRLRQGNQS